MVNDGSKGPPCSRCGRNNHTLDKYIAQRHVDGTMLHVMGSHNEAEYESDSDDEDQEVSKDSSICGHVTNIDFHCGSELEDLMFLQRDTSSLKDRQSMSSKTGIKESWILLDSQSTIDVFCNSDLLTKIHKTDTTLRIRCNAGMKTTDYRGYLSGYGWVWYYPEGIANILSLSRAREQYRITFDSAMDNCFHVHKDNGKILRFQEAGRRLYFFDTADRDEEETMLITIVDDNKSKLLHLTSHRQKELEL